jgi:large subunit ribosomal protein L25
MDITATERIVQGTGASRRLRRSGRVPGILYGTDLKPQNIEFDHNELFHKLKHETFHSSILDVKLNGQSQPALLRNVQMHPFRQLVLHVDLQRIDPNKKIHMKVPFHFINAENSPAVKLSAAIVSHIFNEIEVLCLPKDLPKFVLVDLNHLSLGHSVHLSDIPLPEGIEFAALHKNDNLAIVTAVLPRAAKADEETAVVSPADIPATNQKAPVAVAPASKEAPKKK